MTENSEKSPSQIGDYLFKGTIGEGAFSVVKLVQNIKNQHFFACKIISKSKLSTPVRMKRFENEIRIQQQLNNSFIVRVFDLFKDDENFYVILEFCSGGDLFQLIVDKKTLTEEEAKHVMDPFFRSLQYIHSIGVVHRDLKPENILITDLGEIKLSDFGLSKFLSRKSNLVNTPCGSPCYASPETISGLPYNGIIADMWSAGVILYACVTGQLPWTKRDQHGLFKQIKNAEYTIPDDLSDECKDIISKLMTTDTTKRLTAEEALAHEWFDSLPATKNLKIVTHTTDLSLRRLDDFFCQYSTSTVEIKEGDIEPCNSDTTLTIPKIIHRMNASHFYPPDKINGGGSLRLKGDRLKAQPRSKPPSVRKSIKKYSSQKLTRPNVSNTNKLKHFGSMVYKK